MILTSRPLVFYQYYFSASIFSSGNPVISTMSWTGYPLASIPFASSSFAFSKMDVKSLLAIYSGIFTAAGIKHLRRLQTGRCGGAPGKGPPRARLLPLLSYFLSTQQK